MPVLAPSKLTANDLLVIDQRVRDVLDHYTHTSPGVPGLRGLGTGKLSAAAGDDSRLSSDKTLTDADGNEVEVALQDGEYVLATADVRLLQGLEALGVLLAEQNMRLLQIADHIQSLIAKK